MAQRGRPSVAQKRGRRWTILWVVLVLAVVITLMVTEQVAVLYLLGTLSLATLLVVVAWSDLGEARKPAGEPLQLDDAAAIADGRVPVTDPETATARVRKRER